MAGLAEYIKKTTLGLVSADLYASRGSLQWLIEAYIQEPLTLQLDGSRVTDLFLQYIDIGQRTPNTRIYTEAIFIFTETTEIDRVRWLDGCYAPLQMFVQNVPIITFRPWTATQTRERISVIGTWLEIDNPEAVQLCRDFLSTSTRQHWA